MSKLKTSLREPDLDNRLLDDRGPTEERLRALGNNGFAVGDSGIISLRCQQSPIERAVARGTISEQHGRAAAKFYHHWRRSGGTSIPSNWKSEPSPRGNAQRIPMEFTSDLAAFDIGQIRRALKAIHMHMGHSGMSRDAIKLLFAVVCEEKPFERAGQMVWDINEKAAGILAIRYVRSTLRVLTIEWGL